MLLVVNLDFFSSFLVNKKMGTSEEGTKFQCKV